MNKKQRLNYIIDVINDQEVATQEELAAILTDAGLDVTQATVSRDINELGLKKTTGTVKKFKYYLPKINISNEDRRMTDLLSNIVISLEAVNNLVVVKTLSGNASSAGVIIDKLDIKNVLGTIAGDDTLLLIARDDRSAKDIVVKIKEIL